MARKVVSTWRELRTWWRETVANESPPSRAAKEHKIQREDSPPGFSNTFDHSLGLLECVDATARLEALQHLSNWVSSISVSSTLTFMRLHELVKGLFKCLKSLSLSMEVRDISLDSGIEETRVILSVMLILLYGSGPASVGDDGHGNPPSSLAKEICGSSKAPNIYALADDDDEATHRHHQHPFLSHHVVFPLLYYSLNLVTQHVDTRNYPMLELVFLIQGLLTACLWNLHVETDILTMHGIDGPTQKKHGKPGATIGSSALFTPLRSMKDWDDVISFTPLDLEREKLAKHYHRPSLKECQLKRGSDALLNDPRTRPLYHLYHQLLPFLMSYAGGFFKILYHTCTSYASQQDQIPSFLLHTCTATLSSEQCDLLALLSASIVSSLTSAFEHLHYYAYQFFCECQVRNNYMILTLKILSSSFPSATTAASDPLPNSSRLNSLQVRLVQILLHSLYALIHQNPSRSQQLVAWKATGLLKRCLKYQPSHEESSPLEPIVYALFRVLIPKLPGARKYILQNMEIVWGIWRSGLVDGQREVMYAPGLEEGWMLTGGGEVVPSLEASGDVSFTATNAAALKEVESIVKWHASVFGVDIVGMSSGVMGHSSSAQESLYVIVRGQTMPDAKSGITFTSGATAGDAHPRGWSMMDEHFRSAWSDWAEGVVIQ